MIEQWLSQYAPESPYLVIFGILLATGFGLPLPEDIPLLIGGYLCGQTPGKHPELWVMMPGCMIAIVGSDLVLYYLGRWMGPSIHRHPILKRLVGNRNLARAKAMFKKYDARFVFYARFLPGVRAPAFFTAGTFKMPVRRFLLWDGTAACLSAPWAMLIGYYFHEEVEYARDALSKGKTVGFVIIGVVIVLMVGFHLLVSKKFEKTVPAAKPQPEDQDK